MPSAIADWRDLEQIDDENHVIEPILRVGPSLGRGQIDLDRIGDIGVALIRALLLDRLEHIDVVVRRLKLQFWEMWREIVYVVASAACQFENVASSLGKSP